MLTQDKQVELEPQDSWMHSKIKSKPYCLVHQQVAIEMEMINIFTGEKP